MEALTNPASAIPSYPASGPAFLSTALAAADADGCHLELTVSEPVGASAGCPSRSYRRYTCAASPVSGKGKFLLLESSGTIHVADDRAATPDDPLFNP
jgi:hypothetical protein